MSNHPTITAIEKMMSDDCDNQARLYAGYSSPITSETILSPRYEAFKSGHEAATRKLLTIVEKAIEMAEFYGDEQNWLYNQILKSDCEVIWQTKTRKVPKGLEFEAGGKLARDFQALVAEFIKESGDGK